jgi:hypothetical protein
MSKIRSFRKSICFAGIALLVYGASPLAAAQPKGKRDAELEKETKIHNITGTKRAVYDAFTYVNRIPEKPKEGETPFDFTVSIFSRLANQEGRVLLKAPTGMDMEIYRAFKTFFRYEGDQLIGDKMIGNCASCHVPDEFTDWGKHVTQKGGEATETPSLRNLTARGVDVEKVLKAKMKAAKQKKAGKADEIDDEYLKMKLSDSDIPGLVKFLNTLNDGPSSEFRNLILNVEILDTSEMSQIN